MSVDKSFHEEQERGLHQERRLKFHIAHKGHTVKDANKHQQLKNDVDFLVRRNDGKWLSVSVKAPSKKNVDKYGCVLVETQVTLRSGKVKPGWFYWGTANVIAFVVGNDVYTGWKRELLSYYERNKHRIKHKSLTTRTKQQQNEAGHACVDGTCAALPLDELRHQGVLRYSGKLQKQ